MLCASCKKKAAIIFVNEPTKTDKDRMVGYCYNCAKEKGNHKRQYKACQLDVCVGFQHTSFIAETRIHHALNTHGGACDHCIMKACHVSSLPS